MEVLTRKYYADKYVISATPLLMQRDENGITHLSLRKFLKEGL